VDQERAAALCRQGGGFEQGDDGSRPGDQPHFERDEADGLYEDPDGGASQGTFLSIQSGKPRAELRNITFEYDKSNELIVKLNDYRKEHQDEASMIIRQLFDNACMESGLENDAKSMISRINKMMIRIIQEKETRKE
jgi:HSP90 family molecular chaperone